MVVYLSSASDVLAHDAVADMVIGGCRRESALYIIHKNRHIREGI